MSEKPGLSVGFTTHGVLDSQSTALVGETKPLRGLHDSGQALTDAIGTLVGETKPLRGLHDPDPDDARQPALLAGETKPLRGLHDFGAAAATKAAKLVSEKPSLSAGFTTALSLRQFAS